MSEEVIFLGHKVDGTGLHPVHEKVQTASPRIQRWADALSRLPLPEEPEVERPEGRVLMLESSDITLVTADQVEA